MKLFGEYLVEKKIISGDLLAEALIEQLKSLPSAAEVVFEKKLLTSEQILSVFRNQVETKCGFVESAAKLKVWNADIGEKVEEHLHFVRIPLGQVLIKVGAMSLEQITRALDEFLSECELPKKASPPKQEGSAKQAAPAQQAAPASTGEEGGTSAAFCDLFTPALRAKLDALFSAGTQTLTDHAGIAQVKEEIHRLQGAARLVAATQSDKLLGTLESLLETLLGLDVPALKPKMTEDLKTWYVSILGLLWGAQQDLQSSPGNAAANTARTKEFQNAEDQVQVLIFDLGFAAKVPSTPVDVKKEA